MATHLHIAFDNLFKGSNTWDDERLLNATKAFDLLALSNQFHPEYLRCGQHIYGNLLALYRAVLKNDINARGLDLTRITRTPIFSSAPYSTLLEGYSDDVRNAIAHGQITYTGVGMKYGLHQADPELWVDEFLTLYDQLWRTTNSLAVALIIFISENEPLLHSRNFQLPLSITTLLAIAELDRPDFTVVGIVESEPKQVGKQLHVAVQTTITDRTQVLVNCMEIGRLILEYNSRDYVRHMFDIDQGGTVSSILPIDPKGLSVLLEENTPEERIGEIFFPNMPLFLVR